jgi:hypothetical protein
MDVGIVLGGGMYRKMATEATAMGEAMDAMATGEARRVMMAGAARATATATTKTAVLSGRRCSMRRLSSATTTGRQPVSDVLKQLSKSFIVLHIVCVRGKLNQ